jgi:(5-formylfuran-3-yl)methyl phosphate synthase
MTLFLASVRDAAEAEMALGAAADIIDLKDPSQGALGALAPGAIEACMRAVNGRAKVSATVGDLPLRSETLRDAVRKTASLGVDYVKLGLFADDGAERCLTALKPEAARFRLILVLFADALPPFDAMGLAAGIGACGVMFDTLGKGAGALPDHLTPAVLAAQLASARTLGLTVGLAGSLKARHVPGLLALEPDLLGFRGALCRGGQRGAALDPGRLAAIRALIPKRRRVLRDANLTEALPQASC